MPTASTATHSPAYRNAVIAPDAGPDLLAVVAALDRGGHDVGGETYSRTPRGYSGTPDQERLLRHSALYAHFELPPDLAVDPGLVPTLLRHWRAFAPLHRWLEANVHLNAEA